MKIVLAQFSNSRRINPTREATQPLTTKENMNMTTSQNIQFTRVKNDVNGNPCFVCHFLNLNTEEEKTCLATRYTDAAKRANKLGGKKFHNKQYAGGIVFQAYECELPGLEQMILELLK